MRLPSSCEIVSCAEGGEDRVMVLENKEKKCVTAYLANERKWTRNEILLKYVFFSTVDFFYKGERTS